MTGQHILPRCFSVRHKSPCCVHSWDPPVSCRTQTAAWSSPANAGTGSCGTAGGAPVPTEANTQGSRDPTGPSAENDNRRYVIRLWFKWTICSPLSNHLGGNSEIVAVGIWALTTNGLHFIFYSTTLFFFFFSIFICRWTIHGVLDLHHSSVPTHILYFSISVTHLH